jgi:hypothetical protein
MVWDYSLANIEVLRANGVNNTYHAPLGYDETMENPARAAQTRDIDVTFVGAMNEKRQRKLQQLASLQLPAPLSRPLTTAFSDAWGEALRERYRRSKLGLNLHYYGGKTILEVHRILPLVVSKVLVLSETSDDHWLDNSLAGVINYTVGDDLRQSVISMLNMDIEHQAQRRYQQLLSCCRYVHYLQAAVQQPYPIVAQPNASLLVL